MRKMYYSFILIVTIFSLYVVSINLSLTIENIDWLKIKRIRFYGLKSIMAKDLVESTSLDQDTSLVFLNKAKIKNIIEEDKRLSVLSIDIKLPDTLEIHLLEEIGDLLFREESNLYVLNRQGEYMLRNENINFYDLPILNVKTKDSNKKKEEIKKIGHSLVSIFEALPPGEKDFKDLISEINIDDKTTFYLRNGIKVIINNPLTLNDIRKARYSVSYALGLEREVDTIDTRSELVFYRFD